MKRYWVFVCDFYYPSGGIGDFVAQYDTMKEARANQSYVDALEEGSYQDAHIFDTVEMLVFNGIGWNMLKQK